jgi:hypothetical protein
VIVRHDNFPHCCRSGRDYKARFAQGISHATKAHHDRYNYRVSGDGTTAEYHCASLETQDCVRKWLEFENEGDFREPTSAAIKSKVSILRGTWKNFVKDPQAHVDCLFEVCGTCSSTAAV